MWAMFGTTLRGSLSWLAGRYGLAALLGAVAGTLSYLGGAKLGAVTMHPNRAFSVAALAAGLGGRDAAVGLAGARKPFPDRDTTGARMIRAHMVSVLLGALIAANALGGAALPAPLAELKPRASTDR